MRLVVFLVVLYYFYRLGLWDTGGNMRLRQYLDSLWGRTQQAAGVGESEADILQLNKTARAYFRAVYGTSETPPWAGWLRLAVTCFWVVAAYTFAVSTLVGIREVRPLWAGNWFAAIFGMFFCGYVLDQALLIAFAWWNHRKGVPLWPKQRVPWGLERFVGDNAARSALVQDINVLQKSESSFANDALSLPKWWLYGNAAVLVVGFCMLLAWVGLPALAYGVAHGIPTNLSSALLSLLAMAVFWVAILDSAQKAFPVSGYGSTQPSFPLAVLYRDAAGNC